MAAATCEIAREVLKERLASVRAQIRNLRIEESRLCAEMRQSAAEVRDCRLMEDHFHALMFRYVGFELFDYHRAYLLPKKTYVAQSGRYVLLGFDQEAKASEFFDAAYKVIN